MNILYAASEALPFAASGGLADVAGSLPKALVQAGHDARVVMPYYVNTIKPEQKEKMHFIRKCIFRRPEIVFTIVVHFYSPSLLNVLYSIGRVEL